MHLGFPAHMNHEKDEIKGTDNTIRSYDEDCASVRSHSIPALISASHFLLIDSCGKLTWNACGTPGYLHTK
jgi:hypothetical protein